MYTAELKMPQEHSYGFKHERVELLLQQMGLAPSRDTLIGAGNGRKGITGSRAVLFLDSCWQTCPLMCHHANG